MKSLRALALFLFSLQTTFAAPELTQTNLGTPTITSVFTPVGNGLDITASGTDLGTTARDQGAFAYERVTGDFDRQVRLQSLSPGDSWSKAALMARENLDAASRFAAAVTTPSVSGTFFQYRSVSNAVGKSLGSFPVNYPETWLRLQRTGNQFNSYASYDGQGWVLLGSLTLALEDSLQVGLALSSHSASATTVTARFRDYAPTLNPAVVPAPRLATEPLGPSSRRTGLVISEIMYHPPARTDLRDIEFVELFNSQNFFEDISGLQLSGDISFRFPPGTLLPAGGFLVVAKNPGDLKSVYGITNVMGPYLGNLSGQGGVVRLRDSLEAILLEVPYATQPPWPVAPDGAGHSLVLARPSYGEGYAAAWAASSQLGGSPGVQETTRLVPLRNVVINELLAHTDPPRLDYIELYNHSTNALDLIGCALTDDPATNKFLFSQSTLIPAGGHLVLNETQLGFRLNAAGETVLLRSPDVTGVLDAVRFGAQENGISYGRWPDGAEDFSRLKSTSPGAANPGILVSSVVINEIMYDPISGLDDEEYVELYNAGTVATNIGGWKFVAGIDFTIPEGTMLAANGYLVLAKNSARLLTNYPTLTTANTLGNFSGTLANGGERLALAMPDLLTTTNANGTVTVEKINIVVDEVTYEQGGQWTRWAHGGGSSLELVDARSDKRRPSNWQASDETAKSAWTTVEWTGIMDLGLGGYNPDSLQIFLQGTGECLVDNVEVIGPDGVNRVVNGNFDQGLEFWALQGDHDRSYLEIGKGFGGSNRSLHLVAEGRGDTGANRIRNTLTGPLAVNTVATLRARVRWLKGWPEILLRLRGNWLEAPGRLLVPGNLGTPGARNSRALDNIGPAIYEVAHSPVLPAAFEPVVVTARIQDPDGISSFQLRYRLDPFPAPTLVAMNDAGTDGDAVAGDGIFSGTIPGQTNGSLVAFSLQATDPAGGKGLFPNFNPSRECLVGFDQPQPAASFGVYRLLLTFTTLNRWTSRDKMNNAPLDGTFVYGNSRAIYNMGAYYSGSPFHMGGWTGPTNALCDYLFTFPEDNLFLGTTDFILATIGNINNDSSYQREQAAFWIGKKMGIPTNYRRYVHVYVNGVRRADLYEDSQQPNSEVISQYFPKDNAGDLHKIEDWFEFNDAATGFSTIDATLNTFVTTGGAKKLARYRWNFRKRAVKDSANNYTNLFALVDALNAPVASPGFFQRLEFTMNVEEWLRLFALEHIVGNWDSYGYNRGKNMYAYKPAQSPWVLMPWDIDMVLGVGGDGPTTDLFRVRTGGLADTAVNQLYTLPVYRRTYLAILKEAANGPLAQGAIDPLLDAKYNTFRAHGLAAAQPSSIKTFISDRRKYILGVVSNNESVFAITSNNGNNSTTNRNLITLSGTAGLDVGSISINGLAYPVTWSSISNWSIQLPLSQRTNPLQVVGLDRRGNPLAGSSNALTIPYSGQAPNPAGNVVINEIHYNPALPGTSFVELHNRSTNEAFDLSNFELRGAGFFFPAGTLLKAQSFLVVVANVSAFTATYGWDKQIAGKLGGSLQNGGETLRLLKPGATPETQTQLDGVTYGSNPPWPLQANGLGSSLQLIDSAQDHDRVANWAAALPTPGQTNSVIRALQPFPSLRLNEILSLNTRAQADRFGEKDPWVEMYNSGTTIVSLAGISLTDSSAGALSFSFPNSTQLAPGKFLQVWLDGQVQQSIPTELHAPFRPATNSPGTLNLSAVLNGTVTVLDSLSYPQLLPDRSFGLFPDGQVAGPRSFYFTTPAASNNPAQPPLQVFINEWMAGNDAVLADPADKKFQDWFELYNPEAETADLSGFYLTDTLTNKTLFRIPSGYTIPPGGYLLVWADDEKDSQNVPTNTDLHVNFQLKLSGEAIGLFTPGGVAVDTITFGNQTNNLSQGRSPDGSAQILFLPSPTPRSSNVGFALNHRPSLEPMAPVTLSEGGTLTLDVLAGDPDFPTQTLTYGLGPNAPAGCSIDPLSGRFTWSPSASQAPSTNVFTVQVRDNGTPVMTDSRQLTVVVLLRPRIARFGLSGDGSVRFSWDTYPNKVYRVQYTDSLTYPAWVTLGDDLLGDGQTVTLSDTLQESTERYYRLQRIER